MKHDTEMGWKDSIKVVAMGFLCTTAVICGVLIVGLAVCSIVPLICSIWGF